MNIHQNSKFHHRRYNQPENSKKNHHRKSNDDYIMKDEHNNLAKLKTQDKILTKSLTADKNHELKNNKNNELTNTQTSSLWYWFYKKILSFTSNIKLTDSITVTILLIILLIFIIYMGISTCCGIRNFSKSFLFKPKRLKPTVF